MILHLGLIEPLGFGDSILRVRRASKKHLCLQFEKNHILFFTKEGFGEYAYETVGSNKVENHWSRVILKTES